ncbi:unnamed protein product [Dovyalis caffra]|uniref:Uncharacterized protein n=1 Tax=Dovyalis caffra TaxID=77055 RepID=A0AAV1S8D9_9ROSI|nr:unnamed protein product [Dovyalis caffra]
MVRTDFLATSTLSYQLAEALHLQGFKKDGALVTAQKGSEHEVILYLGQEVREFTSVKIESQSQKQPMFFTTENIGVAVGP